MSPLIIFFCISVYIAILYVIAHITSRKADNATFFIGQRRSPWYLVAFGMIGASISGVSFVSVPGWVGSSSFSYMQMVLGYLAGYAVIALVLMPVYYKMQLTSIYTYLDQRFGKYSHLSGATFFLLSRTIGSALRIFLSANVVYLIIFKPLGISFPITAVLIVLFIYLFTFRGGIRTVVFTDTLQTAFMLISLITCIFILGNKLNLNFGQIVSTITNSPLSKTFFFENWAYKKHFLKQFLSGAFICITMTGLDQDLMQKNLSCKSLKDAQKNMLWYSITLVPVNLLFLSLGVMLYTFCFKTGFPIPKSADDLFPIIATQPFMPSFFLIIFILGLISTTYSSSDSALTALTTSFTLDILKADKKGEKVLEKTRKIVHIFMALLLVVLIFIFKIINNQSVISAVFTAAGYTYGPLLGLYSFGLFSKRKVKDKFVPIIAILSPLICLILNYSFNNIFGFEMLIINGFITFVGLWIISHKN